MLSVCSVRKLFNKTVATLFDFHYPRNQQVAKWVINAKVLQVEKRQYPSTGHSGDTYVTFFDNTIGPVKGLIHAALKLAELADRGRLPQLRAHIALLCFALPCLALLCFALLCLALLCIWGAFFMQVVIEHSVPSCRGGTGAILSVDSCSEAVASLFSSESGPPYFR